MMYSWRMVYSIASYLPEMWRLNSAKILVIVVAIGGGWFYGPYLLMRWGRASRRHLPIQFASGGAMLVISDAVKTHANSGFATFATVKDGIEAGEITTTAEIDAAFA
jgi:hypothetical protein